MRHLKVNILSVFGPFLRVKFHRHLEQLPSTHIFLKWQVVALNSRIKLEG